MKVILIKDVKGRGKKSEIIEVQAGYGNYLINNGFGIVALVAMTPLIVIQILGLIYKIKLHINFLRKEYPYEDVIEFDIDFSSMK